MRNATAAVIAKKKTRLKILKICAEIGLQALIKLKSPGCEFLDLCDEKDAA